MPILRLLLLVSALALPPAICSAQAPAASYRVSVAFDLAQGAAYTYTGGFGREFEVGVLAGRFHLEAETSAGRYFLAEKPSVWWKAGQTYFLLRKAGLWVPADPNGAVRIYFYNRGGQEAAKSLEEVQMLARGNGSNPQNAPEDKYIPPALALIDLILASADTGAQLHPAPASAAFSQQVRAAFSPEARP